MNRIETNNLPEKEFKTLLKSILSELRRRVDEFSENFNKEIGNKNRTRKPQKVRNEDYIN